MYHCITVCQAPCTIKKAGRGLRVGHRPPLKGTDRSETKKVHLPLLRPRSICIDRLIYNESASKLRKTSLLLRKSAENRQYTLNIRHYYGSNMVRFVRTLQHRVTAQERDFYALSIPPQVAEALGLQAGGPVAIEVRPIKKGVSEIVLKPRSIDDNLNP